MQVTLSSAEYHVVSLLEVLPLSQMDVATLLDEYQRLRSEGRTPVEAWEGLHELYRKGRATSAGSGDIEQGWRSLSGKLFERLVLTEMDSQLSKANLSHKLRIASWSELPNEVRLPLSERLWVRGELTPVEAESYVDIAAYEIEEKKPLRVISAYSCKVSLRERFQQDFFWAERLRSRGIRFCFITMDRDGGLIRAAQTGKANSKQVRMATALYDRIYLFLADEDISYFRRVFRGIEGIAKDLQQWLIES